MTHRITPAEITARRLLMIECKRSQDAAMVGQMQADIKALRDALKLCVDDLAEWAACSEALTRAGFNMDDTVNRVAIARDTLEATA